MTCAARKPVEASGSYHGVPLDAWFCVLPLGHTGPHHNPGCGDFADGWRPTPEQCAALLVPEQPLSPQ